MIRRTANRTGIDTRKAYSEQIKCFDESVEYSDGIVLVDEIVETFGEQGILVTIYTFDESLHQGLAP